MPLKCRKYVHEASPIGGKKPMKTKRWNWPLMALHNTWFTVSVAFYLVGPEVCVCMHPILTVG